MIPIRPIHINLPPQNPSNMSQDISPRDIEVAQCQYALPQERIAQYPLAERDASKLLIYRGGEISESTYREIARHLPVGCLLVFNDTKVIPARLHFQTPTGATIEVLCLEPVTDGMDPGAAVSVHQSATWKCMVGNAKRWKADFLEKQSPSGKLQARLLGREANVFLVEFTWAPAEWNFGEVLQAWGEVPIPPYFDRESEEIDRLRYQTVYAGREGSVAAPTAGLHFTDRVFEDLREAGINWDFVTLHVGAGTFLPIKGERLGEHEMHAEWIDVDLGLVDRLIAQLEQGESGGGVVAVGTTSLRTLESLYWMGVRAMHVLGARATANPEVLHGQMQEPTPQWPSLQGLDGVNGQMQEPTPQWPSLQGLEVGQWDAYELPPPPGMEALPEAKLALEALRSLLRAQGHTRVVAKTRLLIVPAYRMRVVRAIVTNFHQPGSTLLLLVGAFLGADWQRVYQYALDNDYRFLSYGDGGLYFLD